MIEVLKAGLETCVQDFPGRYGFWEQGFPPSGPFDMWSFRLANLLVGNAPEAAGLEIQFLGPTLRFEDDTVIALTGATMAPKLDGAPISQWESVAVPAGAVLETGFARIGARAYLVVAGGIDSAPVLGARSLPSIWPASAGWRDTQSKTASTCPSAQAVETAGPAGA